MDLKMMTRAGGWSAAWLRVRLRPGYRFSEIEIEYSIG